MCFFRKNREKKRKASDQRSPVLCVTLLKEIIYRATECFGKVGQNGNVRIAQLALPF